MGNPAFAPLSWSRNGTQMCLGNLEKLDICKQYGCTLTSANLLKLKTFFYPSLLLRGPF